MLIGSMCHNQIAFLTKPEGYYVNKDEGEWESDYSVTAKVLKGSSRSHDLA